VTCLKTFSPSNIRPNGLWQWTISQTEKIASRWTLRHRVTMSTLKTQSPNIVKIDKSIPSSTKGTAPLTSSSTVRRSIFAGLIGLFEKKYTQSFGRLNFTSSMATRAVSSTFHSRQKRVTPTTFPTSWCPAKKILFHYALTKTSYMFFLVLQSFTRSSFPTANTSFTKAAFPTWMMLSTSTSSKCTRDLSSRNRRITCWSTRRSTPSMKKFTCSVD